MKLEFSQLISGKKSPKIKFDENPSSGSRVVPCERTDGQVWHQIWWKSVQWEQSCTMRTDRRTGLTKKFCETGLKTNRLHGSDSFNRSSSCISPQEVPRLVWGRKIHSAVYITLSCRWTRPTCPFQASTRHCRRGRTAAVATRLSHWTALTASERMFIKFQILDFYWSISLYFNFV